MALTLGGRLCLCPKNEGARRVLDLGTGSSIWAMEYGKSGTLHLFQRAGFNSQAFSHTDLTDI